MTSEVIKHKYQEPLSSLLGAWGYEGRAKEVILQTDVFVISEASDPFFNEIIIKEGKHELEENDLIVGFLSCDLHLDLFLAFSSVLLVFKEILLPVVTSLYAALLLRWYEKLKKNREPEISNTISVKLVIDEESRVKSSINNAGFETENLFGKLIDEEEIQRRLEFLADRTLQVAKENSL